MVPCEPPTSLGMSRAKELIAIYAAEKATLDPSNIARSLGSLWVCWKVKSRIGDYTGACSCERLGSAGWRWHALT
jgi:hypothetical protein